MTENATHLSRIVLETFIIRDRLSFSQMQVQRLTSDRAHRLDGIKLANRILTAAAHAGDLPMLGEIPDPMQDLIRTGESVAHKCMPDPLGIVVRVPHPLSACISRIDGLETISDNSPESLGVGSRRDSTPPSQPLRHNPMGVSAS